MKHIYNFATKAELDLLHQASMRTLDEVGVMFFCQDAVDIFKQHGFRTDGEKVFISEKDVWEALKTCPKTFDWYGRKSHVTVGDGSTICAPSYGPVFILENGDFHNVGQRDFVALTKLCATSRVLQVSNPNALDYAFMDAKYASDWAQATVLMLDERPMIGMVDGAKNARNSIKMAQEFYDIHDKVVVNGLISVASPLHYSTAMCEALIEYSKAGQAMFITPSSLNGMAVPGSLASLLMVNNAEVLAGVVLTQLINPGTPVLYGIQSHGCDLRYAGPTIGSPEQCLIFSATKALGNYYGLPVRTGGSSCDAKDNDMQAGVESFSTMYATLQSGADLMVHSCGSLDSDSTLSFDKFIYDEEILLSVQRILRGIEVSEETLMFDAVKEIGPFGSFLDLSDDLLEDSTELYRQDYLNLMIPSRMGHAAWIGAGRESVVQRTTRAYLKRLEEYQMPELEPARRAILEKYVPAELLKF